jgi:hypothetical protein
MPIQLGRIGDHDLVPDRAQGAGHPRGMGPRLQHHATRRPRRELRRQRRWRRVHHPTIRRAARRVDLIHRTPPIAQIEPHCHRWQRWASVGHG